MYTNISGTKTKLTFFFQNTNDLMENGEKHGINYNSQKSNMMRTMMRFCMPEF